MKKKGEKIIPGAGEMFGADPTGDAGGAGALGPHALLEAGVFHGLGLGC